ncbi:MAG: hypothetical protein FWD91_04875, partial [Treponema sp.]|nr:hypothetical protein [Treponema sp.]
LLAVVIVFRETIPRIASFALLAGFAVYMVALVRHTLKNKPAEDGTHGEGAAHGDVSVSGAKRKPLALSIVLAVVGAAIIVGGGQLTVYSAVNIARAIGITERVIGLTVVAMGTSLPELVTMLIACRKKEGEFALGFIIGSSIFNIMFVLGVAGLITPLGIERGVLLDTLVLTGGTLLFFLFASTGKRVSRLEGFAMFMVYVIYMTLIIAN